MYEALLGVVMGIALAAACGFRVFVPLLIMGIAVRAGHLHVAEWFAWVGSDMGILVLGVATVLEIVAYYVPWLDNLLDSIATPTAVIAGTIVAASCITDMSPVMTWVLAAVAGGGSAAAVQLTTVATRAVSTLTTGGAGNPIVSTVEGVVSTAMSILAVLMPFILVGVLLLVSALALVWWIRGRHRGRHAAARVVETQPVAQAA